MQQKSHIFGLAGAAMLLLSSSALFAQGNQAQGKMNQAQVQKMMTGWHPASREAITFMMKKYGPPAEMTGSMAVWNKTGPWKRTIVSAQAVQHNFPMPHPDVMEQFIDYRMPAGKFDQIAAYDGSVIVERTKGEISARCDKEGANFLALNLANEIASGKINVEQARQRYGREIKAMKAGKPTAYTQRLLFTPPPSGNVPDRPIM
jgi:hypothetical protein